MKTSFIFLVLVLVSLIIFTGCTPGANQSKGTAREHNVIAGFWLGLWHGFIAPIVFVISLFKNSAGIYEVHNNGAWYDLGYLFSIACFYGGGGHCAARRKAAVPG